MGKPAFFIAVVLAKFFVSLFNLQALSSSAKVQALPDPPQKMESDKILFFRGMTIEKSPL